MFGKKTVVDMISRSAENATDRRRFLQSAGLLGAGAVGSTLVPSLLGSTPAFAAGAPSDSSILNFALNLEYLEAEFYSYAVHGHGLDGHLTHGKGNRGEVVGGHKVNFKSSRIHQYAKEIAADELDHVKFLRAALGSAAVSRPKIDIKHSFTALAQAAGIVGKNHSFDPYASEEHFLLGGYIFEDVGVTAYKGAAPLISNSTYLEAAAGILAVEAYHAAILRSAIFEKGGNLVNKAKKISDARDSVDGKKHDDQGLRRGGSANLVPTDGNGLAYSRGYDQVLNVVYLTPKKTDKGGFFPHGVNGSLNTSR